MVNRNGYLVTVARSSYTNPLRPPSAQAAVVFASLPDLLTTTAAHDVEIVAHNLEDAFLRLTGDDAGAAP